MPAHQEHRYASPLAAAAQAALVADGFSYAMPVVSMRDIPFRTVIRQQYDYSCGSATPGVQP